MHIYDGKLESRSVRRMEQAELCTAVHGHGRTDRYKEVVAAAAVSGILSGPKPPRR